MNHTGDLFAPDERSRLSELQSAFEAWRRHALSTDLLQRDSSLQVYQDVWNAFSAWCVGQAQAVSLESLDEAALERFLLFRAEKLGAELSARHRWRILNLIDRVLAFHALERGLVKNDAAAEHIRRTDAIRRANISDRPALDYLNAEDARRLVLHLAEARPGAVGRRQLLTWQDLRNVTAVALHIGAGLTPGDVRELTTDAPVTAGGRWKDVPWKLHVPGNGNRSARETPMAPWAGQLLKHWLVALAGVDFPARMRLANASKTDAPYLFPNRSGEQWGKMAHYEAVRKVMEAAGIDPGASSGGAFRLRHTFAIRQLRKNKAAEDVARWMGIANPDEMERYRAVLDSYEEAV